MVLRPSFCHNPMLSPATQSEISVPLTMGEENLRKLENEVCRGGCQVDILEEKFEGFNSFVLIGGGCLLPCRVKPVSCRPWTDAADAHNNVNWSSDTLPRPLLWSLCLPCSLLCTAGWDSLAFMSYWCSNSVRRSLPKSTSIGFHWLMRVVAPLLKPESTDCLRFWPQDIDVGAFRLLWLYDTEPTDALSPLLEGSDADEALSFLGLEISSWSTLEREGRVSPPLQTTLGELSTNAWVVGSLFLPANLQPTFVQRLNINVSNSQSCNAQLEQQTVQVQQCFSNLSYLHVRYLLL